MKKYIYLLMAVLSLGFASCSEELLPEEQLPANAEKKLVTLTIQADNSTRLGIQEDENAVHFTWEEGDVLHVVSGTDSYTDFVLTEGAGTGKGIFTAEVSYTEGQNLQIVYSKNPDHPFQLDENGNVQIDLSGQTGQLDERYQYMYGTATYSKDGILNTTLQHLVYTIKLNLSLPPDFTGNIQQLRFFDKWKSFRSNATLMLNPTQDDANNGIDAGDLIFKSYYDSEGEYHQPYYEEDIELNNLSSGQNGQAIVYLYLMGTLSVDSYVDNTIFGFNSNEFFRPCITLMDEAGNQYASIPIKDKWTENGDMYTIATNCINLIDFANEDQADGSEESPYEIATTDQFYSFMLRTSNLLHDKKGRHYNNCHYILSSSIELDDRYPWGSIELSNGSFDGQGYIISGHQTMAVSLDSSSIFYFIQNSTIKNITMDANLIFDTTTYLSLVGGLVARASGSVIENCHNLSSLSVKGFNIGGIVGEAEWTNIFACSNKGSFSYGPYNMYADYETVLGGIAATTIDCTIKGCYSISSFGLLTNYENESFLGGIIGDLPDWNEVSQIIGCWSSPRLQNIYPSNYHMGGFLGRVNNPDLVNISTSYFNQNYSPVGLGGWNGTNVEAFSGKTPTAEQIASMNAAISDTGYHYDEYGTIIKN